MSCPVTLEPYTEENYPLSLECGHSISIAAAQQVMSSGASLDSEDGERRVFRCPLCRSEWDLHPSHHFPKNYALLEMVQAQQLASVEPPSAPLADSDVTAVAVAAVAAVAAVELFLACDVSGSMGASVNIALGLTRLDLVKYNVEMLLRRLATMETPVRVSIISFSNIAETIVRRCEVSLDSLEGLIAKVKALQPRYTTNLLGATQHLIELMDLSQHNIGVVLTDGQPTDEEGMLLPDDPGPYRLLLESNRHRYHSFSMMGYGHQLGHRIMLETARAGSGACTFGSDESMISSVFIRWLAWVLEAPSNSPETSTTDDTTKTTSLFCRQLEKSIQLRDPTPLTDFLAEHTPFTEGPDAVALDQKIREACQREGQVGMAFQPQYFGTWGHAYLIATLRGHELGHAWNFKDAALQSYTTPEFCGEVEKLDRIFEMMPAPTPSKVATEAISYRGMSQNFNNSSSTCWLADSPITLADGSFCLIQNLRAGMEVVSYNPETRLTSTATVTTMVRQVCLKRTVFAVAVGESLGERYSTLLTTNHPILDCNGSPSPRYRHAKEIGVVEEWPVQYVYNMVLDRHHHVLSDGVVCLTMGHGMTERRLRQLGLRGQSVAVHDYFGNMERVAADLEKIGVGDDGFVSIARNTVRRDPQTGWVSGLC